MVPRIRNEPQQHTMFGSRFNIPNPMEITFLGIFYKIKTLIKNKESSTCFLFISFSSKDDGINWRQTQIQNFGIDLSNVYIAAIAVLITFQLELFTISSTGI